jgi:hypothetical protein
MGTMGSQSRQAVIFSNKYESSLDFSAYLMLLIVCFSDISSSVMKKRCLFHAKCSIRETFVPTSGGRDKTSLSSSLYIRNPTGSQTFDEKD